MSLFRSGWEKFAGIAVVLAMVVFLPVLAFGGTKILYVDDDATGTKDGSYAHPYEEISDALKHAKSGTEVYVAAGTYKENITIPKGVEVYGNASDRSKVVIDGDSNDPVVTIKDDADLSHVTVKDGTYGIYVKENAKAHVFDVVVKDTKYDGIHIEKAGKLEKKERAYFEKVVVKNSGKSGIFSKKRFVVLVDVDAEKNNGDGLVFEAGVKAWLEDSRFNDNKGSGAKIVVDGANIWTRDLQFRRNGREGVELDGFGDAGAFGLKKSKVIDNGRYGIAIVARNAAGLTMWKSVFLENNNSYWGNGFENVSKVLSVF